MNMINFKQFVLFKENNLDQPHVISADPPMKIPHGITRLAEAFKNSKQIPIGKEVDTKAGGEKDITMKSKKLYIAGEAVRDYMLGHTTKGYELVTDAHPDEIERICQGTKPPINILKKTKDFVEVQVEGQSYKIETMKNPGGEYTSDPREDVKRRHLTSDSLYYDISGKKIIDYTGGSRHIQSGEVKFQGDISEKMKEDGVKFQYARMLHKIPNAKIDDNVKKVIQDIQTEDSPKKVKEEFWKGLEDLHANPQKYLQTFQELGLLNSVFPKLNIDTDFPNSKSRSIVIASLLKNNAPVKIINQLKELGYSDREIKDSLFLINLLMYRKEHYNIFKQKLLQTSLTKRQIIDWAKQNDLNLEDVEDLINGQMI